MQDVVENVERLTSDGAADFASSGANACAVPNHAILGTLVCLSDSVRPQVYFVVTSLLSCGKHKNTNQTPYTCLDHMTHRFCTNMFRAPTAVERAKALIRN